MKKNHAHYIAGQKEVCMCQKTFYQIVQFIIIKKAMKIFQNGWHPNKMVSSFPIWLDVDETCSNHILALYYKTFSTKTNQFWPLNQFLRPHALSWIKRQSKALKLLQNPPLVLGNSSLAKVKNPSGLFIVIFNGTKGADTQYIMKRCCSSI